MADLYPLKLTGDRTTLREFRMDDLDDVHAIVGDDRVTTWLSFDARSVDESAAMLAGIIERAQVEPRNEVYLAVTPPNSDRLVGFVRLARSGSNAKLGYAIGYDSWTRGYATDAVRTILTFGFRDLKLHRVTAAIGPDNAASVRIVDRLGFSYERRLRDHVFTNGAWRDSLLYSLLAPELADR